MTEQDFNQLPDHIKNALKEANIVAMCTHHRLNTDNSGVMGTTEVHVDAGCYMHNTELKKLVQCNGFVKICPYYIGTTPSLKLVFWTVV
jgi:hypothetical protein